MTEQEKLYYQLGFQKGRISGIYDYAIIKMVGFL